MSVSTGRAERDEGWPAAGSAALSDAALVAASSAAIAARGTAYFRWGAVRIEDEDAMPEPALRARVTGTSSYHVEVWIDADAGDCDCDCPHAAGGRFCEHQATRRRSRRSGRFVEQPPAAAVRGDGRG